MDYATIGNEFMEVTVDLNGGALHSIIDRRDGENVMWDGSCGWKRRDRVLFPFVCRRLDGTYTAGGKEYEIGAHGFAGNSRFAALEKTDESVTLALYSNTETLKIYPYDFVLYVKYTLSGNSLSIRYEVVNPADSPLYYSVGGHVAVKLDGADTKGNFVRFDKSLKLKYILDGSFISGSEKADVSGFEASKDLFVKEDTLMLATGGSAEITVERACGKKLGFSVSSPVIAFWTDPEEGNFVCVEPWWGLPDVMPKQSEISEKPFVIRLDGKKRHECGYDIKLL